MGLIDRIRGGGDDRVVFLGIDGVPYDLVVDHPEVFEHLHALAEAGTGGRIDSIVPPESSACWPALTTGTNPGRTGVYGFQDRERGTYETYIPMGHHVQGTRLWDTVTAAGRSATVLNVPVTFPPTSDVQRMVSGFLSPTLEDATSHPEMQRTLEGMDYRIDVDASLGHETDKTAFVEDVTATVEARQAAFTHVLDADDWDLFFGVFMATDRVNHFLYGDYANDGPHRDDFMAFYRTIDRYVGEIWDRLDDDTHLIVASDHGFTELHREVHCNRWLAENGWLDFADDDHEDLADLDPSTRAYSLIPGRFYLNLEGREPDGAVPREAYETERDRLIDELEDWTGPDGRPVADRVVTGEAAFTGDHTDIAPDVVVLPTDGFDLKAGFGETEAVFGTGPRTGMHKFGNACLFADVDLEVDSADLLDLAPTILSLLDVDTDGRFDGRSLA